MFRNAFQARKVTIKIGQENKSKMLRDYSLIGTSFWIDDEVYGSLGLIGPTRMDYSHNVSAVQRIAEHLTRAVRSFHS